MEAAALRRALGLVDLTRLERPDDAAAIGADVVVEAILESGSLEDDGAIRTAAQAALAAGANFLKASTGKVGPGASPHAARVLLEVVRDAGRGAAKISGGIRTAEQAAGYLALADDVMGPGWATPERFRLGASALVDDIRACLGEG